MATDDDHDTFQQVLAGNMQPYPKKRSPFLLRNGLLRWNEKLN